MHRYHNIILTGELVNMTNGDIFVYEESSGVIKKIAPSDKKLPSKPKTRIIKQKAAGVHYICEPRMADKLKEGGRLLSDIAVICCKCIGRDDTLIARLTWGEDPHIEVRLREDIAGASGCSL